MSQERALCMSVPIRSLIHWKGSLCKESWGPYANHAGVSKTCTSTSEGHIRLAFSFQLVQCSVCIRLECRFTCVFPFVSSLRSSCGLVGGEAAIDVVGWFTCDGVGCFRLRPLFSHLFYGLPQCRLLDSSKERWVVRPCRYNLRWNKLNLIWPSILSLSSRESARVSAQ